MTTPATAQGGFIDLGASPYNVSKDAAASQNRARIQTAIDAALGDQTNSNDPNRGATLQLPPGQIEIDSPVGIDVASDFRAKITIQGHGRGATELRQVNDEQPAFLLKTSTGNVREFCLRDLTIAGGTVGIETNLDAYSLIDNVSFRLQTVAGVQLRSAGQLTQWRNCWFLEQQGDTVAIEGAGGAWMQGCLFGEAGGGFKVNTGWLRLSDPTIHNCQDFSGIDEEGEGNSLFRVTSEGRLHIVGGKISPNANVETLIFTRRPGHVCIEGSIIESNQCVRLIGNARVTGGNYEYPPLVVRPSLVLSPRDFSEESTGLLAYHQLTGNTLHAHENAVIDTVVEYVGSRAPDADAHYKDVDKNNTLELRARVKN